MLTLLLCSLWPGAIPAEVLMSIFSLLSLTVVFSISSVGWLPSSVMTVDSLSYSFVMLTLLILVSCSMVWFFPVKGLKSYSSSLIWACSFCIAGFSASNLLIFYLCFEGSVLPTMFLVMGWGYQPERAKATQFLLLYTLVGSLPLLAGLIWMNSWASLEFFGMVSSGVETQGGLLGATLILILSLAFLIKTPMFLVHLWLPKAHTEAPIVGSMFLAAILLKLGSCGLIRMNSMAFEGAVSSVVLSVSLLSVVWVGLINMVTLDMKVVIAYSSVAHMAVGLILLGLGGLSPVATSLLIFTLHGTSSSSMFFLAFILYLRSNTRMILLNKMSTFLSKFLFLSTFLFSMGMMGAPPSSNLIPETLSLLVMVSMNIPWAPLTLGVILCSGYSLHLFSTTVHRSASSKSCLGLSLSTLEEFSMFWGMLMIAGLPLLVMF